MNKKTPQHSQHFGIMWLGAWIIMILVFTFGYDLAASVICMESEKLIKGCCEYRPSSEIILPLKSSNSVLLSLNSKSSRYKSSRFIANLTSCGIASIETESAASMVTRRKFFGYSSRKARDNRKSLGHYKLRPNFTPRHSIGWLLAGMDSGNANTKPYSKRDKGQKHGP